MTTDPNRPGPDRPSPARQAYWDDHHPMIEKLDGTVIMPDGTIHHPDGTITPPPQKG